MKIVYKEAFSEVNYIISKLPEEEMQKIPIKFRNFIKDNSFKHYEINIDFENDEYKLKEETLAILSIVYRKFLATDEEKIFLENEYKEKLRSGL